MLEQSGTESDLAGKIGCGAAIVGHWRRGRRLPGAQARHKMELLFGIPRRAWDVAPGASVEPIGAAPHAEPVDDDDTLEITKQQIREVLQALQDSSLTETGAARLRDTAAKLLALRSRLERDRDMLEDRLVRDHPEWQRVKATLLRALKPYPDAAAAVAKAIR